MLAIVLITCLNGQPTLCADQIAASVVVPASRCDIHSRADLILWANRYPGQTGPLPPCLPKS